MKKEAEKELSTLYPEDSDGATPIAYLWARTIQCEGPGCGVQVPLMNQRLISKRRKVGVEFISTSKSIDINVRCDLQASAFGVGTVTNAKVTCPRCGFTMSADRYRGRAKKGELGERHYCTILALPDGSRRYRRPNAADEAALQHVKLRLSELESQEAETLPAEPLSATEPRRLNVLLYGFERWGDLLNGRQRVCWTVFSRLLHKAFHEIASEKRDRGLAEATSTVLALALSNILQIQLQHVDMALRWHDIRFHSKLINSDEGGLRRGESIDAAVGRGIFVSIGED
jgi:adenine-specific DNA methylase